MAYRVKEQTARKNPGNCQKCGEKINPGERYRKATARNHPKMIRCINCSSWSRGELETGKLAAAFLAQENADNALDDLTVELYERSDQLIEDIKSILQECATEAESTRDDLQEGYDNLPDGLQNSATGEGIQEKVELLETWLGELQDWDPEEEFDPEEGSLIEWAGAVIEEAHGKVGELEL